MLFEFMTANRDELIARTRAKVAERLAPRATPEELTNGVPLFLTQFSEAMRGETTSPQLRPSSTSKIADTAARHGSDLLAKGFTIAQVVHDYGDICQAVTELAVDQKRTISSQQFHALNLCLDNAIAGAVTEYSRQREQNISHNEVERLGFLAHELRNLVSTAMMAYQVLRSGNVGISGSTGAVLGRSLTGLRDLIDRSLAEVRLSSGPSRHSRVLLRELMEEIEVAATLDATARGLQLSVAPVDRATAVDADRQLLASAVSNLLQNAFKFTHAHGKVSLRTQAKGGRVLIEVEDECGGLPPGRAEELFRPFERRGTDHTGLGLGLAISARGVSASGGRIRVQNLPSRGCVFVIDLPAAGSA